MERASFREEPSEKEAFFQLLLRCAEIEDKQENNGENQVYNMLPTTAVKYKFNIED